MNFEEIYGKYKKGTATDEEKKFVEDEIAKAKKISAILDNEDQPDSKDIIKSADTEEFVKARKKFNIRSTLKIIVIVISCIAILAGAACAVIFGVSYYSASNSSEITEEQAIEYAKVCISEYDNTDASSFIVHKTEKELHINPKLTNSEYVYEIELKNADTEFQVSVNASSGYARITDIDYENDERHNNDDNKYHNDDVNDENDTVNEDDKAEEKNN